MDNRRRSQSHRRRVGAHSYAVLLVGGTSQIVCGSDPSLDNLHWARFTVDGWIRVDGDGGNYQGCWVGKEYGWWIVCNSNDGYICRVEATPDATYSHGGPVYSYGEWFHFAFTYDHDGDKKGRMFINGVYRSITGAAGEPESDDSAESLRIGYRAARGFDGAVAWIRLSDSLRWQANFTPPSRDNPPPVDSKTVEQWNLDEGVGTVARALVNSPTNDGALANGAVWITT